MITTIHQENPQIREMQQENRQLKVSIEEHQRAIELIMSKYRQHTQRQIQDTKLNFERMAKKHINSNVSYIHCTMTLTQLCYLFLSFVHYFLVQVREYNQQPSKALPRIRSSYTKCY